LTANFEHDHGGTASGEEKKKKKGNYWFIPGFKPRRPQTEANPRVFEDSGLNLQSKRR